MNTVSPRRSFLMMIPTMLAAFLVACGGGGGGSGGSGGGSTPTGAASVDPRFAYVANATSNTVSEYYVDAATGQWHANGYVAAGTRPISVTVDPAGKYAYVANHGSGTVSEYTIGSNGILTPMATPTVAAGTNPLSVTAWARIQ